MAIRYKNPQTGEYEVIKIPVMRGEQGHSGIHVGSDAPPTTDVKLWFDPSDTENDVDLANRLDTTLTACYDYMGNDRGSIKAAADANVDWLLGEINTVHYDGQQITATDSIEGRSKSAILKGQTLVNHCPDSIYTEDGWITGLYKQFNNFPTLVKGKTYTFYAPIGSKEGNAGDSLVDLIITTDGTNKSIYTTYGNGHGTIFKTFIMGDRLWFNNFSITGTRFQQNYPTVMILEGEWTQESMPEYFTGMQSVKMPILKTTGKNLCDGVREYNGANDVYGTNFIKVEEGKKYGIYQDDKNFLRIDGYSNNKEFVTSITGGNVGLITIPSGVKYIKWKYPLYGEPYNENSKIMIALSDRKLTLSDYEPYKSNILTVNEDVELRGGVYVNGELKEDILDLISGEYSISVGETVLNGSENWEVWYHTDTLLRFMLNYSDMSNLTNIKLKCDKIPSYGYNQHAEGLYGNGGKLCLIIDNSNNKLLGNTVNDLKTYLSQNPITVQYPLKEKSIKTVDLSDNHVYSYKDVTHYDCSSEEGSLVPTLSVDVPTNLSALVTKQRQQIRTLEEENKELNQELELAIASSEESDNELLAQSFELDFRLMEVEFALDLPMAATFRLGGKAMAMTPYEMAKKLILADNYDRADMEHKLEVYVSKKRMTEAERQELIQLMDEKEGVITIDPVEPEVEETVIEHEAVTIPLH